MYTVLAAGVAGAVFIAGGRPVWHVAVVGLSAALIIVVLAVISRRAGRPVPTEEVTRSEPSGTPDVPARVSEPTDDLPSTRDRIPDKHPLGEHSPAEYPDDGQSATSEPDATSEQSALREQYVRHNPYTRPSTNSRPIPDVQPTAHSWPNPYVDGNLYVHGTPDSHPEPPDTTVGDSVRRGRRRRR